MSEAILPSEVTPDMLDWDKMRGWIPVVLLRPDKSVSYVSFVDRDMLCSQRDAFVDAQVDCDGDALLRLDKEASHASDGYLGSPRDLRTFFALSDPHVTTVVYDRRGNRVLGLVYSSLQSAVENLTPKRIYDDGGKRKETARVLTFWSRSKNGIRVKGLMRRGPDGRPVELYSDEPLGEELCFGSGDYMKFLGMEALRSEYRQPGSLLIHVNRRGKGFCHERQPDGERYVSCFHRRLVF